ncbi:hypothetical protein SCHPADRAFT_945603 [Schizopora paradoxa]|uniref:Uncharacterized protein n=1 Tax=Schizopora paradoxa TaxID=27342 RepID=A0A0H2R5F9_9AGAM|nr:hypothetical protein SCHPADRAFT_945603 [Schizopora paradoxa]
MALESDVAATDTTAHSESSSDSAEVLVSVGLDSEEHHISRTAQRGPFLIPASSSFPTETVLPPFHPTLFDRLTLSIRRSPSSLLYLTPSVPPHRSVGARSPSVNLSLRSPLILPWSVPAPALPLPTLLPAAHSVFAGDRPPSGTRPSPAPSCLPSGTVPSPRRIILFSSSPTLFLFSLSHPPRTQQAHHPSSSSSALALITDSSVNDSPSHPRNNGEIAPFLSSLSSFDFLSPAKRFIIQVEHRTPGNRY